jgi:hypothetical protein
MMSDDLKLCTFPMGPYTYVTVEVGPELLPLRDYFMFVGTQFFPKALERAAVEEGFRRDEVGVSFFHESRPEKPLRDGAWVEVYSGASKVYVPKETFRRALLAVGRAVLELHRSKSAT